MRNILKYVADKDRKLFAADLKTIYYASNAKKVLEALEKVIIKWSERYPNSMKCWHENWGVITPIFKFSMEVRKAIYTTSAFESLNALSETEPPEEYQYLQTFIYTLEFEDEISALIRKCS